MADGPRKRELYDATLITEFGGVEDLADFQADGAAQHDYSYVPGFSDMRVQRDLALGKLARGEIRAKEVPLLPVNCRWFRAVKGAGSDPDQMRIAHGKNSGYRVVTKADIGQPWLTRLPPGAVEAPDGTIKTAAGDNVLMVATQEQARRNAVKKKMATEAMVDGMQFASGGLVDQGRAVRGAAPTIEKKVEGSK